jgi:hypothetical protein
MIKVYVSKRINTSATVPLVNGSTYVTSVVINCSQAGTGWTLKVQDRGSPPLILLGPISLAVPLPDPPAGKFELANDRVRMRGGVDAVTAGTAGTLDLWLTGNRIEQFPI